MTVQEFSELVKATGLVVGALWVAWTFHKLQKAREARSIIEKNVAETQRILVGLQRDRVEQLRQQPVLTIELGVTESWVSEQGGGYLYVTAALENKSDYNLEVSFDESTLAVGHLDPKAGLRKENICMHRPCYFDPIETELLALVGRIFKVGQRRNMVFVVPITAAGGYFVQLHAAYWRIAFEGEERQEGEPMIIHAIEQMIYQTTERAPLPAALPSSAPGNP